MLHGFDNQLLPAAAGMTPSTASGQASKAGRPVRMRTEKPAAPSAAIKFRAQIVCSSMSVCPPGWVQGAKSPAAEFGGRGDLQWVPFCISAQNEDQGMAQTRHSLIFMPGQGWKAATDTLPDVE